MSFSTSLKPPARAKAGGGQAGGRGSGLQEVESCCLGRFGHRWSSGSGWRQVYGERCLEHAWDMGLSFLEIHLRIDFGTWLCELVVCICLFNIDIPTYTITIVIHVCIYIITVYSIHITTVWIYNCIYIYML